MDEEEQETNPLRELLQDWGCQELYSALMDLGISIDHLTHMTEEDIHQMLPPVASRIMFRKNWRIWVEAKKSQEEETHHAYDTVKQNVVPVNWTVVSLRTILASSDEGSRICAYYEKNGHFEDKERHSLADIIVKYFCDKNMDLSGKSMRILSQQIEVEFPTEKKDTYMHGRSENRKNYGGILYNKRNNKRPKKEPVEKIVEDIPEKEGLPDIQASVTEQEAQNIKMFLANLGDETEITCEIKDAWQKSFFVRERDCANFDGDIKKIKDAWPLYGHKTEGYNLLRDDFIKKISEESFERKWAILFVHIQAFMKERIKDRKIKSQLNELTEIEVEDSKHFRTFKLLHSIIKPTSTIMRKIGNKVKPTKVTIGDSQQRMQVYFESDEELSQHITNLKERLEINERAFAPFIAVVTGQHKVIMEQDYMIDFGSYKEALRACFEALTVLSQGVYPQECEGVWYFVQRYLYNYKNLNDDIFFHKCQDLLTYLSEKEGSM